jgi:hypothetical protein
MKLDKVHQEFRNPKVFYPDPKNVDLDRVLINLFLLLRCGGTRPVVRGRVKSDFEKVDTHRQTLAGMALVKGFDDHPEIARQWLETDIFDLVNRGKEDEAVASLRPLHLDAHKIRVAKNCRDYNHADALYAMLSFGEQQALVDLREYLDRGRNAETERYDGTSALDLETLTVLKLVEGIQTRHPSDERVAPEPPVCMGQARVLCDDVQRLLAYQHDVPRPVMIDYLKAVLGLHLALFTLRIARQLPGWIQARKADDACLNCKVSGALADAFVSCPYPVRLTVDMGSDFRSRMAQLAQADAGREFARLGDLVRAIFTVNQLLRYARENPRLGVANTPPAVLGLMSQPPTEFDADFKAQLKQLERDNTGPEEALAPEIRAVLDAGLSPFDTFIELVTQVRQKHHLTYLTQMMDRLFQKNGDFGSLVQGRSRPNRRRWRLGGRLLEVFVQLAVLRFEEKDGKKRYFTEAMQIDHFLRWTEERYGFVIGPAFSSAGRQPVTVEEHQAFQANIRALKDRLREIGFYSDLSDAYNAQTIRPRYSLQRSQETQ